MSVLLITVCLRMSSNASVLNGGESWLEGTQRRDGDFQSLPRLQDPSSESQCPPLSICFWNSLRGEQSQEVQRVEKILGFSSSPPLSFLLRNFLGKKIHRGF